MSKRDQGEVTARAGQDSGLYSGQRTTQSVLCRAPPGPDACAHVATRSRGWGKGRHAETSYEATAQTSERC